MFDDGTPAVVQQLRGKGRLICTAFMPGHSYHKDCVFENNLLSGMQSAIRALVLSWLPPGLVPECKTDDPNISARLIEAPHGAVVVLINASGKNTVDKLVVTLRTGKYSKAVSLEKGPLVLKRNGAQLEFSLPIGLTDIVRLE